MKVKASPKKQSKGGVSVSSSNIPPINHPIFCLRHLHSEYHLNNCESDEKEALINQMVNLSQFSWDELKLKPKHGMGSEKIRVSSLHAKIPSTLTPDVEHVLAFRFSGKKPFVGIRNGSIFHVIFIDRAFNLYDH